MNKKITHKLLMWQILKREKLPNDLVMKTANHAKIYKKILQQYGLTVTIKKNSKKLDVSGICTNVPVLTGSQKLKSELWYLKNIRIIDACTCKMLDGFDHFDNLNNPEINPYKWRTYRGNILTFYLDQQNKTRKKQ